MDDQARVRPVGKDRVERPEERAVSLARHVSVGTADDSPLRIETEETLCAFLARDGDRRGIRAIVDGNLERSARGDGEEGVRVDAVVGERRPLARHLLDLILAEGRHGDRLDDRPERAPERRQVDAFDGHIVIGRHASELGLEACPEQARGGEIGEQQYGIGLPIAECLAVGEQVDGHAVDDVADERADAGDARGTRLVLVEGEVDGPARERFGQLAELILG